MKQDAARNADDKSHDPRLLMAYAEVLYRSKRYAEALPLFNQIYTEAPRTDVKHYEALLRDLECRTELGENPSGIINVIKQHRYLNPDLGGDELRRRFAALLRRNEERMGSADEG